MARETHEQRARTQQSAGAAAAAALCTTTTTTRAADVSHTAPALLAPARSQAGSRSAHTVPLVACLLRGGTKTVDGNIVWHSSSRRPLATAGPLTFRFTVREFTPGRNCKPTASSFVASLVSISLAHSSSVVSTCISPWACTLSKPNWPLGHRQ